MNASKYQLDTHPVILETGPEAIAVCQNLFMGKMLSQKTVEAYSRHIKTFLNWAKSKDLKLADISEQDIKAHLNELSRTVKQATIKQHIVALGFFAKDLSGIGITLPTGHSFVCSDIQKPTKARILTQGELNKLFSAHAENKTKEARDTAILSIMFHCMAKVGDIAALDIADYKIDKSGQATLTLGTHCATSIASRNAYTVIVPEETKGFIDQHLNKMRSLGREAGVMFRPFVHDKGAPIDSRSIRRMFEERARRAHIDTTNLSPQSLRATSIVMHHERGYSAKDLAKMAGLSNADSIHTILKANKQNAGDTPALSA